MHFFSLSKSMLNVLFIFVRYQKFHKSMCHQWFSWLEPLISCFIPFHPFYLSHHRYSLSSRGEDVWLYGNLAQCDWRMKSFRLDMELSYHMLQVRPCVWQGTQPAYDMRRVEWDTGAPRSGLHSTVALPIHRVGEGGPELCLFWDQSRIRYLFLGHLTSNIVFSEILFIYFIVYLYFIVFIQVFVGKKGIPSTYSHPHFLCEL
jgi:hypothetical protein